MVIFRTRSQNQQQSSNPVIQHDCNTKLQTKASSSSFSSPSSHTHPKNQPGRRRRRRNIIATLPDDDAGEPKPAYGLTRCNSETSRMTTSENDEVENEEDWNRINPSSGANPSAGAAGTAPADILQAPVALVDKQSGAPVMINTNRETSDQCRHKHNDNKCSSSNNQNKKNNGGDIFSLRRLSMTPTVFRIPPTSNNSDPHSSSCSSQQNESWNSSFQTTTTKPQQCPPRKNKKSNEIHHHRTIMGRRRNSLRNNSTPSTNEEETTTKVPPSSSAETVKDHVTQPPSHGRFLRRHSFRTGGGTQQQQQQLTPTKPKQEQHGDAHNNDSRQCRFRRNSLRNGSSLDTTPPTKSNPQPQVPALPPSQDELVPSATPNVDGCFGDVHRKKDGENQNQQPDDDNPPPPSRQEARRRQSWTCLSSSLSLSCSPPSTKTMPSSISFLTQQSLRLFCRSHHPSCGAETDDGMYTTQPAEGEVEVQIVTDSTVSNSNQQTNAATDCCPDCQSRNDTSVSPANPPGKDPRPPSEPEKPSTLKQPGRSHSTSAIHDDDDGDQRQHKAYRKHQRRASEYLKRHHDAILQQVNHDSPSTNTRSEVLLPDRNQPPVNMQRRMSTGSTVSTNPASEVLSFRMTTTADRTFSRSDNNNNEPSHFPNANRASARAPSQTTSPPKPPTTNARPRIGKDRRPSLENASGADRTVVSTIPNHPGPNVANSTNEHSKSQPQKLPRSSSSLKTGSRQQQRRYSRRGSAGGCSATTATTASTSTTANHTTGAENGLTRSNGSYCTNMIQMVQENGLTTGVEICCHEMSKAPASSFSRPTVFSRASSISSSANHFSSASSSSRLPSFSSHHSSSSSMRRVASATLLATSTTVSPQQKQDENGQQSQQQPALSRRRASMGNRQSMSSGGGSVRSFGNVEQQRKLELFDELSWENMDPDTMLAAPYVK